VELEREWEHLALEAKRGPNGSARKAGLTPYGNSCSRRLST
jgi:hypothetical protein